MRAMVFGLLGVVLVTPASAQVQPPLTLTVTIQEGQTILNSLAERPWKDINPLMQKLIAQVNQQMAPKPPAPETPPSPPADGAPKAAPEN